MSGTRSFSFADLNSDQGTNTPDVARNAANAAANLVCKLYKDKPGWLTQVPDPTGAGGAIQGVYDSLCRDRGDFPDPPPPPPFNGGQCPVIYNTTGTWNQPGCGGQSGNYDGGGKYGPLSNFRVVKNSSGEVAELFVDATDGAGNPVPNQRLAAVGFEGCGAVSVTFSPTRSDGQPDNCGSLPPTYPTDPPDPGELTEPSPINITPDITIDVNPTIVLPPLGKPPLALPTFVNVGPFLVNFDLGGIDVKFNPTFNIPPRPDPRPDPPRIPPGGDESFEECGDLIDGVNEKLDALLDCDRCEQTRSYKTVSFGVGQSSTINLPANCYAVTVEIVQQPGKARFQSGDNGPDVLYAGWAWWGVNGKFTERLPVDSVKKAYVWEVKEDVFPTNFAFTLYDGFAAVVEAFYYTLPEG